MAALFPLFERLGRGTNYKRLCIQKAIPEKTKIARKYGIKHFKGIIKNNLKYQFVGFTRRIVAGVSSALVV